MAPLPQDFAALALLVFVLGMKHGFDADHLATIDGLTRFNIRSNPRLARFCGALFSLGHGAVVVTISLLVSTLARRWQTPEWLESFGAWVSIAFLITLGLLNIRAVLGAAPAEVVSPVGLKGRFLARFIRARGAGAVALVGALFAFSFDTVSQAALFALTATRFGGWQDAVALGLLFMAGMLVTDGINGLWISRLIRRADQTAALASRIMGLSVGGMSLMVGLFGFLKLTTAPVNAWSEGKEIMLGATVVAVIATSYILGRRLARADASPLSSAAPLGG